MDTVVFDLGGVLVDWDPRHLYRYLIEEPSEMEDFLATVCSPEWNDRQDRGRPFAEGVAELQAAHPDRAGLIAAYIERWPEMLGGPIGGTVDILRRLRARNVRVLALSNWSPETFPFALERYEFLAWFEGRVISGDEGVAKPDPEMFRILCDRYDVAPGRTVFVDDNPVNVGAAAELGFHTVHFVGPGDLADRLVALGLPALGVPTEGAR